MEFQFKKQQYQTDAVTNTVEVFTGQPYQDGYSYILSTKQDAFAVVRDEYGRRNAPLNIGPNVKERLLLNIQEVQKRSNILMSDKLVGDPKLGSCVLDIEMETGTGKTYVYIKTIFELNKRYGWEKFIIVVPSIAIREGVVKSFSMLERHFFNEYEKKAEYFVYDSSNLSMLRQFATSDNIEVMIINIQAFNSFDEAKKNKVTRTIYSQRDEFNSLRPIDVIARTNPIMLIDEPQKAEGPKTNDGLAQFNPLFTINYSATHRTKHNCIYALDAVDAFEQKLVKRISVKGFELKNLSGSDGYLYLDSILLSRDEAPVALVEMEVKTASGKTVRKSLKLRTNDDLFVASHELNQYKDLRVSEILPVYNCIKLSDGSVIYKGDVAGDKSEDALQRVQIRETIRSHFDKEEDLFNRGIKTLSLFFIDEVANYRGYSEDGQAVKGKFAQWFEEEYHSLLMQTLERIEEGFKNAPPEELNKHAYYQYLLKTKDHEASVHNGYFSIDKGRAVNSKTKKDGISDDTSAYDLILRNKERLLSFEEPTRFIFSHSALREGWDNPNVFQICTLRHTNSAISKRQEVGRGLRLCVNDQGERMDISVLGDNIHELNTLTVIANESYEDFVDTLQSETQGVLRERPTVINLQLFESKKVKLEDNTVHSITEQEAAMIYSYFLSNDYIDDHGLVTDAYKQAVEAGTTVCVGTKLEKLSMFIHEAARSTYAQSTALKNMVYNENKHALVNNGLNENFRSKEFKELWRSINRKYFYTVSYDSSELIQNAAAALAQELNVDEMLVKISTGSQIDAESFKAKSSRTELNLGIEGSSVKYDLVGDIAKGANITRRTATKILKSLSDEKFGLFAKNPEQFITRAVRIIKEQKATMLVEHIVYEPLSDTYSSNIFTEVKHSADASNIITSKHITDRLFYDAEVEKSFANELERAEEVCVYAKLPRGFYIPTPVGRYSPDWAVAFKEGQVKHIYFVAETKGDISSMQLRKIENTKIDCARRMFNVDASKIRYEKVATFDDLLRCAVRTV